ncbi:MAG: S1/P1 nuclease, partial [Gemmatimonadales bacterium]
MHFVGDLHQPLHAGYGHDLGGNRHTVMIDGDSLNLHWIWDSRMMERAGYEWQSTAAELLAEISDSDRSSLATADVVQWTNESFQLVESFVYTHEEGAELDLTYESEALAIIRARLAAAGIRLAFVLDAAAAASGQ